MIRDVPFYIKWNGLKYTCSRSGIIFEKGLSHAFNGVLPVKWTGKKYKFIFAARNYAGSFFTRHRTASHGTRWGSVYPNGAEVCHRCNTLCNLLLRQ